MGPLKLQTFQYTKQPELAEPELNSVKCKGQLPGTGFSPRDGHSVGFSLGNVIITYLVLNPFSNLCKNAIRLLLPGPQNFFVCFMKNVIAQHSQVF